MILSKTYISTNPNYLLEDKTLWFYDPLNEEHDLAINPINPTDYITIYRNDYEVVQWIEEGEIAPITPEYIKAVRNDSN